jgi:hypothetical protein
VLTALFLTTITYDPASDGALDRVRSEGLSLHVLGSVAWRTVQSSSLTFVVGKFAALLLTGEAFVNKRGSGASLTLAVACSPQQGGPTRGVLRG